MKTIATINQKGGVGKTTLAIHLATAFQSHGKNSILLDMDPQASASEWYDSREEELPMVRSIQPARLEKTMEEARGIGTDILVIDTAPHTETATVAAARAADLILIPCNPRIMDIRAMRRTAELLQYIAKPTFVIINAAPHQGTTAADAARAITNGLQLSVAPVQFGQRVVYDRALIGGQAAQEYEPGGKAASEVQQLYMWTCKQLGMKKGRVAA